MALKSSNKTTFEKTRDGLVYLLNQTSIILELMQENELNLGLGNLSSSHPPSLNPTQIFLHIEKLVKRINEKSSKILITGDLNSGKSTFVNTLLRRPVVPDDQEPCTALFVEVSNVEQNNGVEAVHGIKDPLKYNRLDSSTFDDIPLEKLRDHVEEEGSEYRILKVYCKDSLAGDSLSTAAISSTIWSDPTPNASKKWENVDLSVPNSLLHNGLVDISLIDSPGLNIDTMKTTALFSKQEEIDVIVFIVNAENHFTLSAKSFLQTASIEKAFVFIVVNRFDSINKKDRNKDNILMQIKEISKSTYDDAKSLVHFLSAKKAFEYYVKGITPDDPHWLTDFYHMEECLRSFVLHKRIVSKLAPAHTYLRNTLNSFLYIIEMNMEEEVEVSKSIESDVNQIHEEYQHLKDVKRTCFGDLDNRMFSIEEKISINARLKLTDFLDEFQLFTDSVEWNGIFYLFDYSRQIRQVVCKLASIRFASCIKYARNECENHIYEAHRAVKEALPASENNTFEIDTSSFENLDSCSNRFLLELPKHSFFDGSDKFEFFKDFLPSVLMGCLSFLGYHSLSLSKSYIRNQSLSVIRIGRLMCGGLALTGCGMILFKLADMKQTIQAKMNQRMAFYFENTNFVDNNCQEVSQVSRRILQTAMYDVQRRFQLYLDKKEISFSDRSAALHFSKQRYQNILKLQNRVVTLQQEVESIEID